MISFMISVVPPSAVYWLLVASLTVDETGESAARRFERLPRL
jgi:hypothetical protein